jgi:SAM-dependent methyltransferase
MPAHAFAAVRDWPGYFAAMAGTPARETLLDALARYDAEPVGAAAGQTGGPRHAVDLACGEGRDTVELLKRGWRVTAIDSSAEGLALLAKRVAGLPPDAQARLTVQCAAMEEAEIPGADLVNASFALPFCHPGAFTALWERIVSALPAGGRFAGQFFGPDDSWANLPDRAHHSRSQIDALLAGFTVESLTEENRPSKDRANFPKHWHVFHTVARRQ